MELGTLKIRSFVMINHIIAKFKTENCADNVVLILSGAIVVSQHQMNHEEGQYCWKKFVVYRELFGILLCLSNATHLTF